MASFSTPKKSSVFSGSFDSPVSVAENIPALSERRAVKFLTLTRKGLETDREAMAALEQEPDAVNTIMVFGKLGSGKSTLMNALLSFEGHSELFEEGHTLQSCTTGVEMCLPLQKFGKSTGPKLAFLDFEGTGDRGDAYDLKLATPVLLTSKVVIFNLACNRLHQESVLSALEILVRAANSLAQRSFKANAFGHLHVVLRGALGTDKDAHARLFDKEDIDGFPEADDSVIEAMEKRNKIRSHLVLAFESISVWVLPELRRQESGTAELAFDDVYGSKIDALKQAMAAQVDEPKRFAGRLVTGDALALVLPELAKALAATNPALNPPSIMDAVSMKQAEAKVAESTAEATRAFATMAIPQPPAALQAAVKHTSTRVLSIFDKFCTEKGIPKDLATTSKAAIQETLSLATAEVEARNSKAIAAEALAKAEAKRREAEAEKQRAMSKAAEEKRFVVEALAKAEATRLEAEAERRRADAEKHLRVQREKEGMYSRGPSYSSYSGSSSSSGTSGMKFYKGGQFVPGGGRAPKGGGYYPSQSHAQAEAPSYSCAPSFSSYSGSSSSSGSSGMKFYKGGQFIPGGGRAPKGGGYY